MLDKCEVGTRYMHRKQFEKCDCNSSSVASARRDERESHESRPGGKTTDGVTILFSTLL